MALQFTHSANVAKNRVDEDKLKEIATLLLERGADATCVSNRSETPLHAAARSGNEEILGKLLMRGADVNATDNEAVLAFFIDRNLLRFCHYLESSL